MCLHTYTVNLHLFNFFLLPTNIGFSPQHCTPRVRCVHCSFHMQRMPLGIWPSKTDLKFQKSTSCSELAVPAPPPPQWQRTSHSWHCCQKAHLAKLVLLQHVLPILTTLKRRKREEETQRKTVSKRDSRQARLLRGSRGAWNNETPGTLKEFWCFKGGLEP